MTAAFEFFNSYHKEPSQTMGYREFNRTVQWLYDKNPLLRKNHSNRYLRVFCEAFLENAPSVATIVEECDCGFCEEAKATNNAPLLVAHAFATIDCDGLTECIPCGEWWAFEALRGLLVSFENAQTPSVLLDINTTAKGA